MLPYFFTFASIYRVRVALVPPLNDYAIAKYFASFSATFATSREDYISRRCVTARAGLRDAHFWAAARYYFSRLGGQEAGLHATRGFHVIA